MLHSLALNFVDFPEISRSKLWSFYEKPLDEKNMKKKTEKWLAGSFN